MKKKVSIFLIFIMLFSFTMILDFTYLVNKADDVNNFDTNILHHNTNRNSKSNLEFQNNNDNIDTFGINSDGMDIGLDDNGVVTGTSLGSNIYYYKDGVTIEGDVIDNDGNQRDDIDVTLAFNATDYATWSDPGSSHYVFNVPYTLSDLGTYNWEVYYPNQDGPYNIDGQIIECFDCGKSLDTGTFEIADEIVMGTPIFSTTKVGPTEPYNVSVPVTARDGTNLPSSVFTNVAVNFYETFENSSTIQVDSQYIGNTANSYSFEKIYGPIQSDEITINYELSVSGVSHYVFDPSQITASSIINVTTALTLKYTLDILGDKLGETNSSAWNTRYYRDGTTFTLSGHLKNQSNVPTSTYANVEYWIYLEYDLGPSVNENKTLILQGLTDSEGKFTHTLELNASLLPYASVPVNFALGVNDTTGNEPGGFYNSSIELKLQGNTSYINIEGTDPIINSGGYINGSYWKDSGNTIDLNVTVLDEFGNGAGYVDLGLYFTNQNQVNESVIGFNAVHSLNVTTNGTGFYSFQGISIPDLDFTQQNVTLNITVFPNSIWTPNGVNRSILTFDYFHKDSIDEFTITRALFFENGTLYKNITANNLEYILNTTFYNYYTGNVGDNLYFNFTIRDQYGRYPLGLALDLSFTNNNTNPAYSNTYTVDAINEGIFKFLISEGTGLTGANNTEDGHLYNYTISVGQNQGLFDFFASDLNNNDTFSQAFSIYGPDPSGIDAGSANHDASGDDLTSSSNITVTVEINKNQVDKDNIRNVTIQYSNTSQGGYLPSQVSLSNFTNPVWTYANMTLTGENSTHLIFTYIFDFDDYGRGFWFVYMITIYDLAGFGTNGTTFGGNTWQNGLPSYDESGAIPTYDHSVTKYLRINDSDNPFLVGMGDLTIGEINVTQVLLVGNVNYGANITSTQDNITISIAWSQLQTDESGYENVSIEYRFLQYNFDTGNYSLVGTGLYFGPFLMINDTVFSRYYYVIQNSEFQYGYALDLIITLYDKQGNTFKSDPLFTEQGGTITPPPSATIITDVSDPTLESNNVGTLDINDGRQHNDPLITVYSNESRFDYNVTYSVADFNGSGIDIIELTWFVNGQTNFTEFLLQNGVINTDFSGTIVINGDVITFSFLVPNNLFVEGLNVTWEIDVIDFNNNQLIINNSNDPLTHAGFEIIAPPTGTTVVPESEDTQSNNALWIIASFLLLLSLLTLYYQRHNIKNLLQQRRREKEVRSTLSELTDEIKRLGAEGKYRRAILQVWVGLERLSREILQAPRKYNQTAKEFVSYLSEITLVNLDTLLTLSNTFELAKYGKEDPTQDDWEDSVKSFEIAIRTVIESGARNIQANEDEDW